MKEDNIKYLVGDLCEVKFSVNFGCLEGEPGEPDFSDGELLLLVKYKPQEVYHKHKFLRLRTQSVGFWHKEIVQNYLKMVKRKC